MEENITRLQEGSRGAWMGIIGNLGLAALKGIAGVVAGSTAMVADAFHSLADLTGSVIVLVAFRFANLPADQCHTYGHGKAESWPRPWWACSWFYRCRCGLECLKGNMGGDGGRTRPYRPLHGHYIHRDKGRDVPVQNPFGKKLRSPALIASAWEHRSDAYTSVAALMGIGGARLGYPIMDPLAGAVVSLAVIKIGIDIGREGIAQLMDRVPEQAVLAQLEDLAASVEGVEGVQKIWVRSMGSYLLVDITIAVRGTATVREGHDVAVAVRDAIRRHHRMSSGFSSTLIPHKNGKNSCPGRGFFFISSGMELPAAGKIEIEE